MLGPPPPPEEHPAIARHAAKNRRNGLMFVMPSPIILYSNQLRHALNGLYHQGSLMPIKE